VTFDLVSLRFQFTARDPIHFAPGKPGNILRGALGSVFRDIACAQECPGRAGRNVRECQLRTSCAYARTFEPASTGTGPSGLADWPRPFVFRASHLDARTVGAGEPFWFDVNLFETRNPPVDPFVRAFSILADQGLGPQRGRADFVAVEQAMPISIALDEPRTDIEHIQIEFKTPTELKTGDELATRPEFGILFARIRDRLSTLRALYGPGRLEIDFRDIGERASRIRMTRCDIRQVDAERRSSRTGQVHGIGGFVGAAEYEGALAEFLPYLEAASWAGVGRHCVWGNGEITTAYHPPPTAHHL
jgi:hypothetical protein